MLVRESGIDEEKVEEMINFFQYNTDDKNADLSLNYFFELDEGKIMFSEAIFNMQRPATNALRILKSLHLRVMSDITKQNPAFLQCVS